LDTVIAFKFTVRPGQGEASGFDLGDFVCMDSSESTSSIGHSPDQGMMIYLSVAHLMDGISPLLTGRSRNYRFIGVDSSFQLTFRLGRDGVSVASRSGVFARTTRNELAVAILSAAEELGGTDLPQLPSGDAVKEDWIGSLKDFRKITDELAKSRHHE
jgi:hypothetical protein